MSTGPGTGIASLLDGKRVCVCAGAGGVGKTTASAAIGLGMAAEGKKAAVLTIDPARRLANSLGMEELGNEPRRVDDARFRKAGLEPKGELWAMMLDAKGTFDHMVELHAPDEATRDAVLANRIYQELSNAVAGSQEYMAMERLLELHEDGDYDLLVLDTPPTRNALDFLDAPERLHRFIDSRSLKFFLAPSRTGLKIFSRGSGLLFAALKRITGVDLLSDLSEFFASFGGMTQGLKERTERVTRLLSGHETVFVLVTSPQADAIREAAHFERELRRRGMPFGGVVVNRFHQELEAGEVDPAALAGVLDEKLARKVAANFEDYRRLAERDRMRVDELVEDMEGEPVILVPYFDDDIHDLAGLAHMNEHLFAA